MSTRRSAKPLTERPASIPQELQKSNPRANTLPHQTPDHFEPENAAQRRHSEENVHDKLQRSVKMPTDLQRKLAFCPPRRRRAPLLRCNMSDLKSVYTLRCSGDLLCGYLRGCRGESKKRSPNLSVSIDYRSPPVSLDGHSSVIF